MIASQPPADFDPSTPTAAKETRRRLRSFIVEYKAVQIDKRLNGSNKTVTFGSPA